jgi:hypothetical protein
MGYTYGMKNLGGNVADAYRILSLLTGASEDNELTQRAGGE